MFTHQLFLLLFTLVVFVNLSSQKNPEDRGKTKLKLHRHPAKSIYNEVSREVKNHIYTENDNYQTYNKAHHKDNEDRVNDALRNRPRSSSEMFMESSEMGSMEYIETDDLMEEKPFFDLTRGEYENKKISRNREEPKKAISWDYYLNSRLTKPKKLKSSLSAVKTKCKIGRRNDFRKSGIRLHYPIDLEIRRARARGGSYEESSSDVSAEKSKSRYYKPKRFEVVDNESSKKNNLKTEHDNAKFGSESWENGDILVSEEKVPGKLSDEEEEYKPPKKKKSKGQDKISHGKKEIYMQGPGRFVNVGPESDENEWGRRILGREDLNRELVKRSFRRRLSHFLPKRYHWNEEDYSKLGYYWFNGPQGRYPGVWKITY